MTTQQFIFEELLYKKVKISENPNILNDLLRCISIDGFNSQKGQESTFRLEVHLYSSFERSYSFVTKRFTDIKRKV